MERRAAGQKARDEAFACRRCSAKFPTNTKLHERIVDHHAKPSVTTAAPVAAPLIADPFAILHLTIHRSYHACGGV